MKKRLGENPEYLRRMERLSRNFQAYLCSFKGLLHRKKLLRAPLIRKAMVQDKQQLTKFEMITSILFVLCYEVNLTKFLCLKRGCIYNNLPYLEI